MRTDSFQNWRNYDILVSSFAIVNIRKELHEPNESGGDVSGTQCMNSTLFQKINPTLQLCLSTRTRPETLVLRIALRSVLAASCPYKCTRPQHTLTNSLPAHLGRRSQAHDPPNPTQSPARHRLESPSSATKQTGESFISSQSRESSTGGSPQQKQNWIGNWGDARVGLPHKISSGSAP